MLYQVSFRVISRETFLAVQSTVLCHAQNANLAELLVERTYTTQEHVAVDVKIVMCLNFENYYISEKEIVNKYRNVWGSPILGKDSQENMRPLRWKPKGKLYFGMLPKH